MSIIVAENTTTDKPIFVVPEMEEAEQATETKKFQGEAPRGQAPRLLLLPTGYLSRFLGLNTPKLPIP